MVKQKRAINNITWSNERRRLADLQPWPRNPRQIREAEAERLAESVETFGQVETLAIGPDNEIYNGHQRLNVLMAKHGPEYEVDVRVSSRSLSEKEREKLTVYLHRGAAGEWDWDILANEFEAAELLEWGFAEWELGIEAEQPEAGDAEPQVNRAEELREQWGVEPGQLWRLPSRTPGQEHRLVCGDCTDASVVERVMGGERADATLISDPPYGIGYEYDSHDDRSNEENQALIMNAWELAPVAKAWTCGMNNLARDLAWNPGAKVLCWHKGFAQAGNGLGGASTWEPVLVVGVKGGTLPNDYLNFPTDRIEGLRDLHTCPKPVGLIEHLVEHLAEKIVYEPFSGSGTTIIACENLARQCRAIEIAAPYVAVALQRYFDAFGIMPELVD